MSSPVQSSLGHSSSSGHHLSPPISSPVRHRVCVRAQDRVICSTYCTSIHKITPLYPSSLIFLPSAFRTIFYPFHESPSRMHPINSQCTPRVSIRIPPLVHRKVASICQICRRRSLPPLKLRFLRSTWLSDCCNIIYLMR